MVTIALFSASVQAHCIRSTITRFQARSKDQEIKRREVELDLQVSPEETMSREVELGCESWTSFVSELFLNSGATDTVFVTLPKHGS